LGVGIGAPCSAGLRHPSSATRVGPARGRATQTSNLERGGGEDNSRPGLDLDWRASPVDMKPACKRRVDGQHGTNAISVRHPGRANSDWDSITFLNV
jgi:hypothetical protein